MTPDEQAILNKAKENLEAAELLLDQGFAGIAASRTYYAMFYLFWALARESSPASAGGDETLFRL